MSTQRAFVIQFRPEANVEQGRWEGRVEHVASGQARHFQSLDELLTFLAWGLTQKCVEPAEENEAVNPRCL
jgi:hypothetical protein